MQNWLNDIKQEKGYSNRIIVQKSKAFWKSMNVPYDYKKLKITDSNKIEDNNFAKNHNNYGLGFDQFGNPL